VVNYYKRGADRERDAVNKHMAKGALLAGRFAGSKVGKGSVIKADVIAFYDGVVIIEQHKKGKGKCTKEKTQFLTTNFPAVVRVERLWEASE